MRTKDIRNGLKEHLAGLNSCLTFIWPNVKSDNDGKAPVKPYAEVRIVNARQLGGTLKGNEHHIEEATLSIQVVIDEGADGGEDSALDHADDIAAVFLEGERISITGGEITIMARPDIRDGFQAETDWRVPILIPYQARATS